MKITDKQIIERAMAQRSQLFVGDLRTIAQRYFEEGARWAIEQMQNNWISVKDKMPEVNEFVLAYMPNSSMILQYNGDNVLSDLFGHIYTHWMPLPKPPKINAMKKDQFFDPSTIPVKVRIQTLIEMDFINLIHHLGYREPQPWTDEDQHILDDICELAGSTADRCLHEFNRSKNP